MCVSRRRRRTASYRRGTVLLLVLVLLTLSAVVTVRLASNGYRIAAETLERERAAVARWSELSCRYTLLYRAAEILVRYDSSPDETAETSMRTISSYSGRFELNDAIRHVTLADEQAKVDLALLSRLWEPTTAADRIRELTGASGLTLRSSTIGASRAPVPPSWEQYFRYDDRRGAPALSFRALSQVLTCWGRGRLHLQAADPGLVRTLCRDVLDDDAVARLIDAVVKRPAATLNEYFLAAQLSEREIEKLHPRLTDGTTRYSLWFVSGDEGVAGASFTVAAQEPGATPITAHFRW